MDHVRGSSLVWPATLETLRPFVLTWWSGRTADDMPADIRAVFDDAGFRHPHLNLALVVLDSQGRYLRASVPFVRPPDFRFDPALQGQSFKEQLDELLGGLKLPRVDTPAKLKLTLPDICTEGNPNGVRIYLTAAANRLNHYRTPIVEAVAMTEGLRKSLQYPAQSRTMQATELRAWLEQIYPAAIMDGQGGFSRIEGKLQLRPAGEDATHRYAILQGTVDFELDNAGRTRYRGDLAVVMKYLRADQSLATIRGVCECTVPKGPERIRLSAAIESLPE